MVDPKITYYARLGGGRTRDNPSGLVRRIHVTPPIDEAFGRDLSWHPTEYLERYYMRGTHDIDHVEITPDEAEVILGRWRIKWAQEDAAKETESS